MQRNIDQGGRRRDMRAHPRRRTASLAATDLLQAAARYSGGCTCEASVGGHQRSWTTGQYASAIQVVRHAQPRTVPSSGASSTCSAPDHITLKQSRSMAVGVRGTQTGLRSQSWASVQVEITSSCWLTRSGTTLNTIESGIGWWRETRPVPPVPPAGSHVRSSTRLGFCLPDHQAAVSPPGAQDKAGLPSSYAPASAGSSPLMPQTPDVIYLRWRSHIVP